MCLNKSDTYSPPNNFQKGTVPHVIKCGTMQKSRQFVCMLAACFCGQKVIIHFQCHIRAFLRIPYSKTRL